MTNYLLKRLNNEIVKWENWYGTWYSILYDSDGHLQHFDSELIKDQYIKLLHEARAVMQVLNKIKRNRFKDIKRLEKRRYKINKD